jgi:phosphoribosyl 1,2-cyclic phosphodiesterase
MKVCVLASGSSANCIYVSTEQQSILIDAGLSGKETARRIAEAGGDMESLAAICLTHEHDDHRSGVGVLHRRYRMDLYANSGTIDALTPRSGFRDLEWKVFSTGAPFGIGTLRIEPFSVPHDSYDPVGFVIQDGDRRLGVVTDVGIPTTVLRDHLRTCHVLVLEANHDVDMLRESDRPWSLKRRISGRQGHFSNDQAAELLTEIAAPQLHTVVLAHLSRDCNTPEIAVYTVTQTLKENGLNHITVKCSYPDRISEVITV